MSSFFLSLHIAPVLTGQATLVMSSVLWCSWVVHWMWARLGRYSDRHSNASEMTNLIRTEKVTVLVQLLVTSIAMAVQMEVTILASDISSPVRLLIAVAVTLVVFVVTLTIVRGFTVLYLLGACLAVWQVYTHQGASLALAVAVLSIFVLAGLMRVSGLLLQWAVTCGLLNTSAIVIATNLIWIHTRDPRHLPANVQAGGLAGSVLVFTSHVAIVWIQRPRRRQRQQQQQKQ